MSPPIKLLLCAAVVAGATAYLAWLGAASSWQYYVLVDECARSPNTFVGQRMRVSGHVAPASLQVSADRRSATFVLQGEQSELQVYCRGLLPDNLAEDMDVVVEGTLREPECLHGEKVITRCASKYQAAGSGT
jgi:cytochrome c-type biogenesis protein CcmE